MALTTDKIRNIALLGHGGNGKTSLAESLLFLTGGTDRLGKISDGNTVGDSDSEEIKRQISISLANMYAEYRDCKINILDTPGFFDFAGEVAEALRVADAGIIVCGAKDSGAVGFEKAWKALSAKKLPKAVFVSKIDEENGDFYSVYSALRAKYGAVVVPLIVPIKGASGKVEGIVDLVGKKAFSVEGGKRKDIPMPDNMQAELDDFYTAINESVAETSEELMEKYFAGEEFTTAEIVAGFRAGVKDNTLVPVVCGCALTGLGTHALLDLIVNLFPSPLDRAPEICEEDKEIAPDPNGAACAFIFKTQSDQFGKFSIFKVLSGKVTAEIGRAHV